MRTVTKIGSRFGTKIGLGVVLACLSLGACGSDEKDDKDAAAKKAEEAKKAEDAKAAKRKAAREAEAKKADEEEAALAAKIDELAVLPDRLPDSIDDACARMLHSYDEFMRKALTGDMLTKWETGGNEMQLAVFEKECMQRDIATAACQASALAQAPPELEPKLADIMKACADKAAAGGG